MNIRKPVALAASALLALTVLAGCSGGGDNTAEFCKAYEEGETGDWDNPSSMLGTMKKLVDNAPSDIKDDLKYMSDALSAMVDAGDDWEAAMEAMQDFDTDRLDAIGDALDAKVEEVC